MEMQQLLLQRNKLTGLPTEIGKLVKLKMLNLNGNPLNSLPKEIANLIHVRSMFIGKGKLPKLYRQAIDPLNFIKKELCNKSDRKQQLYHTKTLKSANNALNKNTKARCKRQNR